MRFAACGDMARGALAAWLGGRDGLDDGDCSVLRSRAVVMDVGAGDFEHKGVATSDGLVSMGLRVGFCLDISGVQEESSRPVEARIV